MMRWVLTRDDSERTDRGHYTSLDHSFIAPPYLYG